MVQPRCLHRFSSFFGGYHLERAGKLQIELEDSTLTTAAICRRGVPLSRCRDAADVEPLVGIQHFSATVAGLSNRAWIPTANRSSNGALAFMPSRPSQFASSDADGFMLLAATLPCLCWLHSRAAHSIEKVRVTQSVLHWEAAFWCVCWPSTQQCCPGTAG
ncbi:hypothetical protein PHYPSEUDO_010054 [Phytophthora pseudosyringae]|uniref:Uncharacterized protein n=1 Tax=Phytophthora pseudosyringae TaxID=221518 RepID=A0A8T1VEA8_9STRA|nr:hypothetical protein PHYPSEUDO_010054 [Phytophthora pseudosyringae]